MSTAWKKIEWTDDYLLNIPEIDIQHKKLVALANELYDAVTGDPERYKLNMSKILKGLGDYTVYHFSSEEAFLKKYDYPALATHKLAHDNFITELNSQVKKLSVNSIEDGGRFYEYVVSWVLTHIAKADRLWADFVHRKQKTA
ncbi:MAG: hemerythrin family protein [Spirochaetes bacterium]|uniref:Hemerythrin family protein n=1 Tax=Candidatus Avitreponema avistercoris TaxID=2840705 RepID=A0A9D9HHS5_9SPIR|nr:hemerythrin family protein [Candidatus Avitreponema avistercoris]